MPDPMLLNALLERPLRQSEIRPLLERLAADDSAHLIDQVGTALEKMATLVHVANQVSTTLDLDTLLDRIVAMAIDVARCDRGTLFLHDPDNQQLVARVAKGDLREEIRIPESVGIAGSVFTTGEAVIIPEAYLDSRFNQAIDRKTGYLTHNILCAPVRAQGREIIGVMQLLNRKSGSFGADDLALLEVVTSQAASALLNARLLDEIRQSHEEEEQMRRVVTTLSSELQLRPLLRMIVTAISDLLGADRSTVFLNDPKTNELYSFLAQGIGKDEIRFPNHVGIAGTVFTSGEAMNIPDAYADSRFNQAIDRQTGYRTQTILCMPIHNRQGKKLGVTQVVNKAGGRFTAADERRLATFTNQVSVAIENATMFDELATVKNYNESMLESMSNGLMTLDEDNRIQKCNRSFLRIFQAELEQVAGVLSRDYFMGRNAWIQKSVDQVAVSGIAEINMDAEVDMASGQKRDRVSVNLNTVPLRGAKGEWLGTMLVFEDITREKRIKSTMARYMAKEVAEKLLESGDDALGGVCQTATVVFSDIRGFTGLSEALGPQETVSMLNEYFTVMVDSVFREGGILDKFIGDAMMALFGVPFRKDDDADRAMRAAISMLQDLRRLNFDRRAEGKKPIKIGIGVNTGEVVSGNIGSVRRMDYTAIGDGVNLASRLEGSCKTYGTQLIVSEFTVAALQGDYCLRDVDCVLVMGKTEPVHLYEALDYTDEETFPCRERVVRIYQEGIAHYRDRDWTQAMRRFYEALRIHPADYLSRLYAERCEYFLKTPPDDDWNGAWTMVTK